MRRLWCSLVAVCCSAFGFGAPQLIAELRPGYDAGLLAVQFGLTYTDRTPVARFFLFNAPSHEHIEQIYVQFLAHPGVVWAEDNDDLEILESTNGKGSSIPQLRKSTLNVQFAPGPMAQENSAWLNRIQYSYVPATQDRSLRVAVLDTGLSPFQPYLWNNVVADMSSIDREFRGYDIKSTLPGNHFYDPNGALGHGTMVASIINQLAPEAELIICRVADSAGFSSSWRIIKGIEFAVTHGAELANISMGSVDRIPALSEVLEWTEANGMVVISALGNDNEENALFPSGYSKVVAVSGVDSVDKKASFSNWDGTADMCAPSVGIRGAYWNGRMVIWSGTSFAVPIVTGCVAEALKHRSAMLPEVLRERIRLAGENVDSLNPSYADRLGRRVNMNHMRAEILRP